MSRSLRILLFCAGALLATGPAVGADLDDVRSSLVADIQRAQQALSATQASVGEERGALAERISRAQARLLELRERTVAARRVADEETLSLQQIESRIAGWREQSQFQGRLLAGFLNRVNEPEANAAGGAGLQRDLPRLRNYLGTREALLYPGWKTERLVQADGQLIEAALLRLGPVALFLQAAQGGLVTDENGLARIALGFDETTTAGLQALQATGSGQLTFDPTLSRALLLAEDNETLLEHLRKGGVWVIPILLFALFASCIAVCKAVSLYRLPALVPGLAERLEHALASGGSAVQKVLNPVQGQQAELARVALAPHENMEQRDDKLYALLLEQRHALERWLGAIAVTASVSPLLGLLGTVSGMITTFRLMTLFGAGDANAVSAGISEALVTTELGLVVAIPALLAHALLSRKVKQHFAQLENDAVHLSQLPLTAPRAGEVRHA